VSKDISSILANWPMKGKTVHARVLTGRDARPQLQLRLDCGLLQMYLDGRPDGTKPHKCQTFLEYLERRLSRLPEAHNRVDRLPEGNQRIWAELDREMTQFYHRRVALLAVAREAEEQGKAELAKSYYDRAVRDADYTLLAMDFINHHCDDEEYVEVHERFRPFVLWHRTIALTQRTVLENDFDQAIEQIKCGVADIVNVYEQNGLTKWAKHDRSLAELKQLEKHIRRRYGIKATLNEQLAQALAKEDYESAAKIRDELKAKGRFPTLIRPTAPGLSRM